MSSWTRLVVFSMLICAALAAAPKESRPPRLPKDESPKVDPTQLPKYDTKYYVIYSDLPEELVHDVAVRVTKVAEVYAQRTAGFSGSIRNKFPLVLFTNAEDYYATGAPQGSGGMFDGRMLMVIAGDKLTNRTWHLVQHEGFHQFAAAVIGGDIPVWANEGLAEYFGEGVFTGDDLLTGVIPEWRRKRIVKTLDAGGFMPIDKMMELSLNEWNGALSVSNYDQAWSMVHFLAHGDGGKYQPAFIRFMNAIGKGQKASVAWHEAFGDSRGFEQRWKLYWSSLPENPSDDLYRRATVLTLTSFLARATAAKQTFESIEDFTKAAAEDLLKTGKDEALPRGALAAAMKDVSSRMEAGETFSIERPDPRQPPTIVCRFDGKTLVGKFTLKGTKVGKVTVEDVQPKPSRGSAAPRKR